jgi:hypothetical protein
MEKKEEKKGKNFQKSRTKTATLPKAWERPQTLQICSN